MLNVEKQQDIKIIVSIFEPTSMYHFLKKSPGFLSELLLKNYYKNQIQNKSSIAIRTFNK